LAVLLLRRRLNKKTAVRRGFACRDGDENIPVAHIEVVENSLVVVDNRIQLEVFQRY
jgi:hypothetical protein